jgi:hypothetical protein
MMGVDENDPNYQSMKDKEVTRQSALGGGGGRMGEVVRCAVHVFDRSFLLMHSLHFESFAPWFCVDCHASVL